MLPFLTSGIPGIGGSIKESPEDFIVSEIPAYEACGSGSHLYLQLEKRGLTTLEAIRRIAARLKLPERDIGYAGMKDSVGITRQTISIPWLSGKPFSFPDFDCLKLNPLGLHTNKLKLGHLRGNHFEVVVQGVSAASGDVVSQVLDILRTRGVPNYFGYQRYGSQGDNHLVGLAMLRHDWKEAVHRLIGSGESLRDDEWRAAVGYWLQGDVEQAARCMPRHCRTERDVLQRLVSRPGEWQKAFNAVHPRLRALFLSACQSFLFDQVVAARLDQIDRLQHGDLAWIHRNGACFLVEDARREQARAAEFEISPSGPLFGARMMPPGGATRELEQAVLRDSVAALDTLDWAGMRVDGGRRPLRVPLEGASFELNGDRLRLEFTLPRGSYATAVVREITKGY